MENPRVSAIPANVDVDPDDAVSAKHAEAGPVNLDTLVHAMRNYPDDDVLVTAVCEAISNLTQQPQNLEAMFKTGCLVMMADMLKKHNVPGSLAPTFACGCIANMAGNPAYHATLANCGAIPLLVEVLTEHIGDNAYATPACRALAGLAVNADNQLQIGQCGAIGVLMDALNPERKAAPYMTKDLVAVKAMCDALGALSAHKRNQEEIVTQGGIAMMLTLMQRDAEHFNNSMHYRYGYYP